MARSEVKLDSLSAAVSDLPNAIGDGLAAALEGQSSSFDIDSMNVEQMVEQRSKIQTQKSVLQGQSNKLQRRIDDEKQRTTQLV